MLAACFRSVQQHSRPRRLAALRALFVATMVLLGIAPRASATAFTLEIVSGASGPGGLAQVGDTVVVDLRFETNNDPLQAWFLMVDHPGQTALAVSQVPYLLVGGQLASPLGVPVINSIGGGTATGNWAFVVQPPNAIPVGVAAVFGRITLELQAPGIVALKPAPGGTVGCPGPCCTVVCPPRDTYGSFQVVPEPAAGLLVALGLALLASPLRRL